MLSPKDAECCNSTALIPYVTYQKFHHKKKFSITYLTFIIRLILAISIFDTLARNAPNTLSFIKMSRLYSDLCLLDTPAIVNL